MRRLPVALTARGVGFLVSAVVVGVLWRVLGLQDLRYLMVLPVVMVLLSLLVVAVVPPLARPRVRVDVPAGEPEVGDTLTSVMTVSARFPVTVRPRWTGGVVDPAGPSGGLSGSLSGGSPDGLSAAVTASRTPEEHRTVHRAARRGLRHIGVDRLVVPDPLGLAVRRIRVDAGREVLVVPRALDGVREDVPSPVPAGAVEGEDAGGVLSSSAGAPAGAVREFRHGDTVRQVHWKQSARQGKLLVNQYEAPRRRDLHLVFVDVTDNYLSAETFEVAVSAAVTVADRMLATGHRVVLSCGDRPGVVCGDGGEVRRQLALVTHRETGEDASGAGASGPAGVLPVDGADVVVTGHVTDALSGELDRAGFSGDLLAVEDPEARA